MNAEGFEMLKQATEHLHVRADGSPPNGEHVRYVTVQVTGVKHATVLNALHEAGLMKRDGGYTSDLVPREIPEFVIAAATSDWLTLEDSRVS